MLGLIEHMRISAGDSADPFGTKATRNRRGTDLVGGIGDLLAMQDGEPVDLLDDVADVHRGRGIQSFTLAHSARRFAWRQ